MTKYEKLLCEYGNDVDVYEEKMRLDGLYADGFVWINKDMHEDKKCCVLAEELGHYFTSAGDIINQHDMNNVKQEYKARAWAFEKLLPFEEFERAVREGCHTVPELAEYLNLDEEFVTESIEYHKRKLGIEFPLPKPCEK